MRLYLKNFPEHECKLQESVAYHLQCDPPSRLDNEIQVQGPQMRHRRGGQEADKADMHGTRRGDPVLIHFARSCAHPRLDSSVLLDFQTAAACEMKDIEEITDAVPRTEEEILVTASLGEMIFRLQHVKHH